MEEEGQGSQQQDEKKVKVSSILRPGSMGKSLDFSVTVLSPWVITTQVTG